MPEVEEQVEVPVEVVNDVYNTGTSGERALLRTLFPTYAFPLTIIEQVPTFEAACAIKGVNPADVAAITFPAFIEASVMTAFIELLIITEVLNEGWTADIADPSQEKHWPTQLFTGGGSIINGEPFFSPGASPSASFLLAFKSRELANYAGTQFLSKYIAMGYVAL